MDIRNAKSNAKNSGFLPEERDWMSALIEQDGWVDAYRSLNPTGQDYTWWSQRGAARAKNVGWRIDYQMVSPNLKAALRGCSIAAEPKFSDHAPFTVDYS
jgi:exodeoxyribonuclease-3